MSKVKVVPQKADSVHLECFKWEKCFVTHQSDFFCLKYLFLLFKFTPCEFYLLYIYSTLETKAVVLQIYFCLWRKKLECL